VRHGRITGLLLVSGLALTGQVLTGCTGDGPPTRVATDLRDLRGPQDLVAAESIRLDAAFRADLATHVGRDLTLRAVVARALSPSTFTVTGSDGEVVPLLVVATPETVDVPIEPGQYLHLAGVPVRDFDAEVVADELDLALAVHLYDRWEGETFFVATVLGLAP
jgi:hypothetical protein